MSKNVWLYFGDSNRTLMVPASRLRGMHPYEDGVLLLSFDSITNTINTPPDKVTLNLFEDNTHLEVMKAIGRAIHNNTPTFNGFVVVANEVQSPGFHVPEYLTDHDGTEGGKIASIATFTIQDPSSGSITAAADSGTWANGATTRRAGFWSISSDNASKVVHLPPCHEGARVEYLMGTHSGFILRAEVSTDFLNGTNGEIGMTISNTATRVVCVGVSSTKWLVNIYSNTGVFDSDGAGTSLTSNGEDINITATGSSVNISATENVADSIVLSSSNGGIDILAPSAAAGEDIDIVATGSSVHLSSSEDVADAITLTATAGGIDIAATGEAGQDVDISNTGGSVNISASEDTANAVTIVASLGGIDISAAGEAGQDIDIMNLGGSVSLTSSESVGDSIKIESTAGGIDILASGAAAGEDIDIAATGSSVNITSSENVQDAMVLNASSGGINLNVGDGRTVQFYSGAATSSAQIVSIGPGHHINHYYFRLNGTTATSTTDGHIYVTSLGGVLPQYAHITRVSAVATQLSNLATFNLNVSIGQVGQSVAATISATNLVELIGAGASNSRHTDSTGSAVDIDMGSGTSSLHKVWWNTNPGINLASDSQIYVCTAGTGNTAGTPTAGTIAVTVEYFGTH